MKHILRTLMIALCLSGTAGMADENVPTPELHRLGMTLYSEKCSICHGPNGEGDDSLSGEFSPKPRNFVQGTFRFSSTELGDPPSRLDIMRVIENGIEGSYGRSMPAFDDLTLSERLALAEVVRQFADLDEYGTPFAIPPRPDTIIFEDALELFSNLECAGCHGDDGDGNGLLAESLEDVNGEPIKPATFQTGKFKGGNSAEEIFLRIYRGINGTPMPSFGQNVPIADIWAVAEIVIALGTN